MEFSEIFKKKCISDIVNSYTTTQSLTVSRYFWKKKKLLYLYISFLEIVQIDRKSRKHRAKEFFCPKIWWVTILQGVLVCRSAKLEDFSGYAVDLRDLLIPGQLLEKIENFPKFRLSHSHRDAESINTIKWGVTTLVSLLELYL